MEARTTLDRRRTHARRVSHQELGCIPALRERRRLMRLLAASSIIPISVLFFWVLLWVNHGKGPVHGLLFYNPLSGETLGYAESCAVLAGLLVVSFLLIIACCKSERVVFGIACGLVVWLLMSGLYLAPYLTFHPVLAVPGIFACVIAGMVAWLLRRGPATVLFAAVAGFSCAVSVMVPLSTYDGVPIARAETADQAAFENPYAAGADLVAEAAEGTPLAKMSAQELCDFAAQVVHIEYQILGIPGLEPKVIASITGDCASCYIPSSHTIVLSVNNLRAAADTGHVMLMECVLHEMAHVYEWAMVEGWIPYVGNTPLGELSRAGLEQWRHEMCDPTYPEDDGDAYRAQDIEVRAREYQRNEIYRYIVLADAKTVEVGASGLAWADGPYSP